VHLTIIAKKHFWDLLRYLGVGDEYIHLPSHGLGYFLKFFRHRTLFPDFYILLTNSFRGDLEAKIIGCPKIFGLIRPGRFRPLQTRGWKVPDELSSEKIHQSLVIKKFFESMGLSVSPDTKPLVSNQVSGKKIALICGSENSPEKRWPVKKWRELIDLLLKKYIGYEILLVGTSGDAQITGSIKNSFSGCNSVIDLAGKTSLVECVDILSACSVAIGNDTGGIHMANMAGCPVVVIYGPTNPLRTGPIFDSPIKILKKSECLDVKADINEINVDDVIVATEDIIQL
jgi:hypothetical protein